MLIILYVHFSYRYGAWTLSAFCPRCHGRGTAMFQLPNLTALEGILLPYQLLESL